jgi:hypothetical protein
LLRRGKPYEALGGQAAPVSAAEAGEQRKTRRALEAPLPGAKSRH